MVCDIEIITTCNIVEMEIKSLLSVCLFIRSFVRSFVCLLDNIFMTDRVD